MDDGTEAGMWMTVSNKTYDFAYTRDHTGTRGRFHHLTYAVDSREEVSARRRYLPRKRGLY